MNDREWEEIRKRLERDQPVSEAVSCVREMKSQMSDVVAAFLQMQANQQAQFERLCQINERVVGQLIAVCTPQAAKLSATLTRAGNAGVVGPVQPIGSQQSLPTPPPAFPGLLDDDEGAGTREPVDIERILADSQRMVSPPAAFQPPRPPFPIAPPNVHRT